MQQQHQRKMRMVTKTKMSQASAAWEEFVEMGYAAASPSLQPQMPPTQKKDHPTTKLFWVVAPKKAVGSLASTKQTASFKKSSRKTS